MAYDEKLAARMRKLLAKQKGLVEKTMFGGLAFMVHGKMCCGLVKDTLMVRVGPEQYQKYLREPHVRPMDFTGKPLKGFVYVDPEGLKTGAALRKWLQRALEFVTTLPRARGHRP